MSWERTFTTLLNQFVKKISCNKAKTRKELTRLGIAVGEHVLKRQEPYALTSAHTLRHMTYISRYNTEAYLRFIDYSTADARVAAGIVQLGPNNNIPLELLETTITSKLFQSIAKYYKEVPLCWFEMEDFSYTQHAQQQLCILAKHIPQQYIHHIMTPNLMKYEVRDKALAIALNRADKGTFGVTVVNVAVNTGMERTLRALSCHSIKEKNQIILNACTNRRLGFLDLLKFTNATLNRAFHNKANIQKLTVNTQLYVAISFFKKGIISETELAKLDLDNMGTNFIHHAQELEEFKQEISKLLQQRLSKTDKVKQEEAVIIGKIALV